MNTAEVAKEYDLHPETVRDYARRGIIRANNFGGRRGYHFDPAETRRAMALHFGNTAQKEITRRAAK